MTTTTEPTIEPGIYPDMADAPYRALDARNHSTLSELARSPLHFEYRLAHPREDCDAFRVGRATHCAVFEPSKYLSDYALWPERRGTKAHKEFIANLDDGVTVLTAQQNEGATAIGSAVNKDPVAAPLLRKGEAEVTVIADLEGVRCKGRLDWICDAGIVDLKTTIDPAPEKFGKNCAAYGYHRQAAFYVDLYHAATGERKDFYIVAAEKTPPYDVVTYKAPHHIIRAGRDAYRELLAKYKHYRDSGEWPGLGNGQVNELWLPEWALINERTTHEDF